MVAQWYYSGIQHGLTWSWSYLPLWKGITTIMVFLPKLNKVAVDHGGFM